MAAIQIPAPADPDIIEPRVRTDVWWRPTWQVPWRPAPYWEPITASQNAAPSIDSARLLYRGGKIKREDLNSFSGYPNYSQDVAQAVGSFIRIRAMQDGFAPRVLFTGRISRADMVSRGESRGPNRDYEFTALGMAAELDRVKIYNAYVTNQGDDYQIINRPLTFNERFSRGVREIGNRSGAQITANGKTTYLFAGRSSDTGLPSVWTGLQIVDYLLKRHAPFEWVLAGNVSALSSLDPLRIQTAGRTIWDILNEIIDRRRGIGFTVEPEQAMAAGGKITLRIFSLVETPVSLGPGVADGTGPAAPRVLPANSDQADIKLKSLSHLVGEPTLTYDIGQEYEYIRVRGSPVVATFTVSHRDGTLVRGWTDTIEAEYLKGDPVDSRKHDLFRQRDRFRHVFGKFVLRYPWNWTAGNGDIARTGGTIVGVNPVVNPDGTVRGATAMNVNNPFFRSWGLRLLNQLPLQLDVQQDPAHLDTFEPQYRDPFVIIWDEKRKAYKPIDAPAGIDDLSASVRALDNELGLMIRGSPNHLLAKNHWPRSGIGVTAEQVGPTQHVPTHDWTEIIATVAMEQDEHLQVMQQVPNSRVTGRILTIEAPDCQYWWVRIGTVTDLDSGGQPKRTTDNITVRDDSARLRAIAGLAAAWYGRHRASLTLPYKSIWLDAPPVGRLIPKLHLWDTTAASGSNPANAAAKDVNSVISQVSFDFQQTQTVVEAGFGELDFSAAAGGSLR
jgi:hypothetical protein